MPSGATVSGCGPGSFGSESAQEHGRAGAVVTAPLP